VTKPCSAHEVQRIRELYAAGWSQGRIAREFQRTVGTIGRIVRGETHQQLPKLASEEELAKGAAEAQRKLMERFLSEVNEKAEINDELKRLKEE
jgi:IS30 family transposase